nr:phage integrase Arm DNA-binding domain-containing protein [Escherichia coli]
MGRRRSHERRDLPPNLYIRNNGYYCEPPRVSWRVFYL